MGLLVCMAITAVVWANGSCAARWADWGAPAEYRLTAASELRAAGWGPPRAPPAALQVRAALQLRPLWRSEDGQHELLELKLSDTALWTLGSAPGADWRPRQSSWPRASASYAELRGGRLVSARATALPAPAARLHRALHALLQVRPGAAATANDTDVHGDCLVEYAWPDANTLHKIKRGCTNDPPWLEARRLARYSVDAAGAVEQAHAEDVLATPGRAEGVGVTARGWLRLERVAGGVRAPAPHARLEVALAGLPADVQPLSSGSSIDADEEDAAEEEELPLEDAVRPLLELEQAGEGGSAAAAAALPAALAALRRAAPAALRGLLDAAPPAHLPAAARLLGLAGTTRAAAALRPDEAPPALQLHYYAALGSAPRPEPALVDTALRRGLRERRPAAVLGAAAASARLSVTEARAVRDELAHNLARATDDDAWLETLVAAMGNLRRADTVDALLEYAERGSGRVSLAALDGLRAADVAFVGQAFVVRRLARVALALRTPLPLETRAAALELALERGAEGVDARPPLELAWLAVTLYDHGPPELLRLYWQLADQLPALQPLLKALPPAARGWWARAAPGASLALTRPAGWAAGRRAAVLRSLQAASGGLLRRGSVRLGLAAPPAPDAPALGLHLWTQGLEALTGADAADGEEGAAGGLTLEVLGTRLPGVTLFEGQAALLAAVWAGAGSEPTPVLRAELPLAEGAARLRLVTGDTVRLRWSAAAALALDAAAQASLWARTARAGVELRAGLAGAGGARLAAAGAALAVDATARWEPRLTVDADLDFYGVPQLCVRVGVTRGEERRGWREARAGPGPAAAVRRGQGSRSASAHGLRLDAAADKACRALAAH